MNPEIKFDIDSDGLQVRTINGKLTYSPDLLINPTDIAKIVFPLPKGYKREKQHYVIAANELEMTYEIVDKEIYV